MHGADVGVVDRRGRRTTLRAVLEDRCRRWLLCDGFVISPKNTRTGKDCLSNALENTPIKNTHPAERETDGRERDGGTEGGTSHVTRNSKIHPWLVLLPVAGGNDTA